MAKYFFTMLLPLLIATAHAMELDDTDVVHQRDCQVIETKKVGNCSKKTSSKIIETEVIKKYKQKKAELVLCGITSGLLMPVYGVGIGLACATHELSNQYKIYKLFKAAQVINSFDQSSILKDKKGAKRYADAVKRINENYRLLEKIAQTYPTRNVQPVEPQELIDRLNAYASMPLLTYNHFFNCSELIEYLFLDNGKKFNSDRILVKKCQTLLGKDISIEGKTSLEVKRMIINKFYPNEHLLNKNRRQIDTIFELIVNNN